MRHIDLFTGIGGFSLAASWVWEDHTPLAFCEKDEYCQKVLRKHWPDTPITSDIHDFDGTEYHAVDLVTGGFPCQPYSQAGLRKGKDDDRHLWPEMLRVIREARPRYVVGENVYGLLTWNDGVVFDEVLSDLEGEGYEVVPLVLPAAGVNAPHRRDRVWIVAHSRKREGPTRPSRYQQQRRQDEAEQAGVGCCGDATHASQQQCDDRGVGRGSEPRPGQRQAGTACGEALADADRQRCGEARGSARVSAVPRGLRATNGNPHGERRQERHATPVAAGARQRSGRGSCEPLPTWAGGRWPAPQPAIRDVDDGVPSQVDRLRALGNAIVPQVAEQIFRALKAADPCAS